MSNLRDRIAAALADHLADDFVLGKCACGLKLDEGQCNHQADAVIAELGLREEKRTNPMSSAGYTVDSLTGERKWHSDIRHDRRYVTGWENDD